MADGNGFKSIADILNIDGQDGSFDDDDALKARERQEERDAYAKQLRERVSNLSASDNDDNYKREMLKLLGAESMEVLMAMKNDVEDNPTARGAECFATVMTSIVGSINSLEKIDNNAQKIDIDNKKIVNSGNPALVSGSNNNVVMVGSTNDLLDMLEEGGIINSNTMHGKPKVVEAEVVSEIEIDDENA